VVVCEIPDLILIFGKYTADLWLEDFSVVASLDIITDAVSLTLYHLTALLLGVSRRPLKGRFGSVLPGD